MSKSKTPDLAHLLEHHADASENFCELCEASSIASVVLPHAIALGDRSEIPAALMAVELAAQCIEGISDAEQMELDVVFAALQRRVKILRAERASDAAGEGAAPAVRH